jgi:hypothetical protein
MSVLRTRVLATVVAALVGVTGFSAVAVAGQSHARKHPPAHRHHKHAKHHKTTIPQHNGGDHDADNNGGPSDGDGNI